ncbi:MULTISPECIES: cyd operon protein YbgE [Morganella]|uniref:Cyd operon protein YbgE n=1 Tax=Morganella morganii TaxID=582 RepID=A0A9Q4CKH7_MORMO|nr:MULTISPECIES: cyd operon protein YbgE [Morganella]BEP22217.1 cyd operon protein YbgE [Morganella morganii subsp. sibonii]HAE78912.1 cyd operon protein YbgE [Morganella sp. (in: enterobacteria)]EGT3623678.1 cyd operon protein YbgE [Morganella morganii]EGT3632378.1 cyd operon protein YbgE [Morganella morganii]EGT3632760.1 cyd operon protein YbgE [Morganella morganii]
MLNKSYQLLDKGPLRALVLVMALGLALCVIWDPSRFAANTSSLQIWQGLLMIWAVCSGAIFGTAFRPERTIWKIIFHPLPAVVILGYGLYHFFS